MGWRVSGLVGWRVSGLAGWRVSGLAGLGGNLYKPKTVISHRHEDEKRSENNSIRDC